MSTTNLVVSLSLWLLAAVVAVRWVIRDVKDQRREQTEQAKRRHPSSTRTKW